jgi:two-component system chemotaxis response regulator CheB
MVTFSPIRVFLVDDSPVALTLLKRMLATSSDIEVVGTARNGKEALSMFADTRPKVICTDYHMPTMDGLELIREVMVSYPRPILVISSAVDRTDPGKTYALLQAGAVDVFPKPTVSDPFEETARQLVQKIRILAGVFVITRRPQEPGPIKVRPPEPQSSLTQKMPGQEKAAPLERAKTVQDWLPALPPVRTPSSGLPNKPKVPVRMVVIGSSTGGPQVLQAILSKLPTTIPCPVLCVQHISKGFLTGLVDWLHSQCRLQVKIGVEGETALPGIVYFPPEGMHLEVDSRGRLTTSQAPPVDGHRPSVTVTFQSVARHYGNSGVAVLLTGMGSDGASGMQSVFQAGGLTIAQDESSSVVFGMPKQAIELGAAQYALPPDEISQALLRVLAN